MQPGLFSVKRGLRGHRHRYITCFSLSCTHVNNWRENCCGLLSKQQDGFSQYRANCKPIMQPEIKLLTALKDYCHEHQSHHQLINLQTKFLCQNIPEITFFIERHLSKLCTLRLRTPLALLRHCCGDFLKSNENLHGPWHGRMQIISAKLFSNKFSSRSGLPNTRAVYLKVFSMSWMSLVKKKIRITERKKLRMRLPRADQCTTNSSAMEQDV